MKESWKDITGHEGYYQVSNLGRVRSIRRSMTIFDKKHNKKYKATFKGRILRPLKTRAGYNQVYLLKFSHRQAKKIHRLLALSFLKNPLKKPCINHKNGIKTDNRLCNLEWVTHSENTKHAMKIGLHVIPRGEKHGEAKLNEKQVRLIKHLKNIIPKMNPQKLSEIFPVSADMIRKIWKGENWKHVIL